MIRSMNKLSKLRWISVGHNFTRISGGGGTLYNSEKNSILSFLFLSQKFTVCV